MHSVIVMDIIFVMRGLLKGYMITSASIFDIVSLGRDYSQLGLQGEATLSVSCYPVVCVFYAFFSPIRILLSTLHL